MRINSPWADYDRPQTRDETRPFIRRVERINSQLYNTSSRSSPM
jgi:hypothetical protein